MCYYFEQMFIKNVILNKGNVKSPLKHSCKVNNA